MSSGLVVGYDGSDYAKAALATAAEIAHLRGEKLIIAFGYQLNKVTGEIGDYHHALEELAQSRLEEAAGLVANAGVEVEAVIMEEAPAKALVDLADTKDARMIVVGTRGENPLHGALIGSTPHKLVHMSKRPVLVVPLP
ncbi:MAG TPA: universal stress protein [Solirubrobacteraceae bacterium]|jgi:nucleotide-binding universal stress UspA family protein|nr:universal stress protein [Solirubrobacteraceae bacterium]